VQRHVQLRLHDRFGDVQIRGNTLRRPAKVLGLSNHLSVQWLQPIQGFADQRAIDWAVGRAPVVVAVRGHDVSVSFNAK
jgi:hypothetical protein